MATKQLLAVNIKRIVEQLVEKAKREIAQMPKHTWTVHNLYVSEIFLFDKTNYIFSFKCSPPTFDEGENFDKMMFGCEICIPSMNMAYSRPLMYEPTESIIKSLDNDDTIMNVINCFEDIIEDFSNT